METWYAHAAGKPVVAYTGGAPAQRWTVYVAAGLCAELEDAVAALDSGVGLVSVRRRNGRKTGCRRAA